MADRPAPPSLEEIQASAFQSTLEYQTGLAAYGLDSVQNFLDQLNQDSYGQHLFDDLTGLPDANYGSEGDSIGQSIAGAISALPSIFGTFLFPTAGLLGAAPTFDFTHINPVSVPSFSGSAPVLTFPDAPSAVLPSVPATPTFLEPATPDVPGIVLPTSPVLTPISLPSAPSISFPSFTSTLPINNIVTPSRQFEYFEALYESDNLTALKAKLKNDLINGGYGIETFDEEQLWERTREREIEGAKVAIDESFRTAAARGFPLPPGQAFKQAQQAQYDLQAKVSSMSREIALKRADMFVENRKFAISQTTSLEQILIGYANSVAERSLNAARATIEFTISIYNAQVAFYNVQLEAYKASAQVFGEQIRAVLGQVEVYRTQLEGSRIQAEISRQQVEIYATQIRAVDSIVNIYRTQTEVAQIKANIQRIKLEAFKSQIEAFSSQVQAKTAEFGMYESRIRGEEAKLKVFEVQVSTFNAQVNAAKTQSDVALGNLRAETEQAGAKINIYNSELARYKTDIDARTQFNQQRVAIYSGDIAAFQARLQAIVDSGRIRIGGFQADVERNAKNAEIQFKNAEKKYAAIKDQLGVKIEASKYNTEVFKALVNATTGSTLTQATKEE